MKSSIVSQYVEVDGLRLHYLDGGGSGEPVLFLHGWPTSSFLWRRVMAEVAKGNRVIALDLPGFGKSDKPVDASYSFRFYNQVLDDFLKALEIDKISLAIHDFGGPVGLYWACHQPQRLHKLAILNTLVYPEMSWAVVLFVLLCRLPGLRSWIASPGGLRFAMRLGVSDTSRITPEVLEAVQAPFASREARRALVNAGTRLHPGGFKDIARLLPALAGPVRVIYGERDRILPDVAKTMRRVAHDLPQAEVTALPDCGHFLQEERGSDIGRMLADFFAPKAI
jgi:pimeloyl-ACP methyl ester carboxylesterase